MRKKKKTAAKSFKEISVNQSLEAVNNQRKEITYEGENLADFLKSIQRELESARALDTALPLKIWLKQQFSIGVNDVTRVLERMPPVAAVKENTTGSCSSKAASVELQAILVALDCNPRWLTKHLSSLTSSRNVPIIFVKDKKGGSLRLGELVKLKTAIAIGVKARGNAINLLIENTLPIQQVQGGAVPLPET